jgi:hypothetical protein
MSYFLTMTLIKISGLNRDTNLIDLRDI